jgi:polar amino acid transport system substrate-binding protein
LRHLFYRSGISSPEYGSIKVSGNPLAPHNFLQEALLKIKIAISILLILRLPLIVGAQELTIISENNPPFNFVKQGEFTGSSGEIVREMLRRMNRNDKIQVLTWARGYNLALTLPNVILFSTARTRQRENLFHWVGPLYRVRFGFYARKEAGLRLNSLEDAKKVGAIATYKNDVREQLLKSQGFTNLDSSKSPASNLKKLMAGRVDMWLYSNLGVKRVARQIGVDPDELELVLPFKDYFVYIAISRGTDPAVVNNWRDVLNELKQESTFEKITKKWLPAENLPPTQTSSADLKKADLNLKVYTENSPPASYLTGGRLHGRAVEVVREIMRRLQIPLEIEVVPWARGYSLATSQPNVALFSTTRLPQREKLFKWVGPIYSQTWGFYGKKDSGIQINSLEEAKRVARIGTYHKDAKDQYLQAKGFRNLISANRNISNIRHLMDGHIDLWVSSDFNMPFLARQAMVEPDKLELVFAFKKVRNYIAFSLQTNDKLVRQWQQTLDAIKHEGIYDRLINQ